ncbi:MAG: hypothetical protein IT359_10645 [Gemmatimonadaceae bacterium]|nr:hypothetical protein [Gemmatimonadaceae bacterium]
MNWIAEREFQLEASDGVTTVKLLLGAPYRVADVREWRCAFHITGLPDPIDQWAAGEDGLQALQLALVMARICLDYAPLPPGTHLTWLGEPTLGLPSADAAAAGP